jgi:hypothetical protein
MYIVTLYNVAIWDPHLGPPFGTPIWDPHLGPPFGTPIWDPHAIWDPNFFPYFGNSLRLLGKKRMFYLLRRSRLGRT